MRAAAGALLRALRGRRRRPVPQVLAPAASPPAARPRLPPPAGAAQAWPATPSLSSDEETDRVGLQLRRTRAACGAGVGARRAETCGRLRASGGRCGSLHSVSLERVQGPRHRKRGRPRARQAAHRSLGLTTRARLVAAGASGASPGPSGSPASPPSRSPTPPTHSHLRPPGWMRRN
jgi:hypothetical protein